MLTLQQSTHVIIHVDGSGSGTSSIRKPLELDVLQSSSTMTFENGPSVQVNSDEFIESTDIANTLSGHKSAIGFRFANNQGVLNINSFCAIDVKTDIVVSKKGIFNKNIVVLVQKYP